MGPAAPVVALLVVLVVLFVGSALLHAAVALANRIIGPVSPPIKPIGWDWDAEEDEDEDEEQRAKPAMPEPGLGQGMVILFLTAVAEFVVGFLLTAVFEGDRWGRDWTDTPLPYLLVGAAGFLVMLWLLAGMLPTTAKRAALATLCFHLIIIIIVALVLGLVSVMFNGI